MIRIKEIEETTQASSISSEPASHHTPDGRPDTKHRVSEIINKINGEEEDEWRVILLDMQIL